MVTVNRKFAIICQQILKAVTVKFIFLPRKVGLIMPYESAFDVPYQIYRCLFENATTLPKNTRVAMVTTRKATQKSPMKPVNYGIMTQSTTESHRPDTPVLGRCYVRDTHFQFQNKFSR